MAYIWTLMISLNEFDILAIKPNFLNFLNGILKDYSAKYPD